MAHTQVILELDDIRQREVKIHIRAKLLYQGSHNSYADAHWLRGHSAEDPFTPIGAQLLDSLKELETYNGLCVMFGSFGILASVPVGYNLQDMIWSILAKIRQVLPHGPLLFTTFLGDDAFMQPEFLENPDRAAFDENINRAVAVLRERRSREIIEAERTIERLTRLLEQSQYMRTHQQR